MADELEVRPLDAGERGWLEDELRRAWGLPIISRERVLDAQALPALVCVAGGAITGFATYDVAADECELVTLNAAPPRRGAGTALLCAVADVARARGCRRLWLVTTNDNVDALRFYQRRGLRLVAVHAGAMDVARRDLKPSIARTGLHGIPIRDEIELELSL